MSNKSKIKSKDGLNIYYWIDYNKSRKNKDKFFVLYPGSSMNHTSLNNLSKKIVDFYDVSTISLDPRGFGISDIPHNKKNYGLNYYTSDLAKIIEKEGIENPTGVGHSFGFMPIIDYASKNSNMDYIVGICASYKFSETAKNKFLFHLFDKVLRYSEFIMSGYMNLSHLVKGETRPKFSDEGDLEGKSDFDVYKKIVDISFKRNLANTQSGRIINTWDISEQLKNINKPMLLIYGEKDPMVGAYAGDKIKDLVKGECEIETIKGTHSPPITNPKDVFEVMQKYLRI